MARSEARVWTASTVVSAESLVGPFQRLAVDNGYLDVTITRERGAPTWRNGADVTWSLDSNPGALESGADCLP